MRLIRVLFIAVLVFSVPGGVFFARIPDGDQETRNVSDRGRGRLDVNQDERLNDLVGRYIRINREMDGMEGYRIRIFSESGQRARTSATDVRAKFFNKYPDIETYLVYDAPNFKVYVGDYRTRSEALKIQKKISSDYPYSFIISDRINFPSLD
ncbi:MAG: SPOR domain-containing protein [Bacteroidales bacterium]